MCCMHIWSVWMKDWGTHVGSHGRSISVWAAWHQALLVGEEAQVANDCSLQINSLFLTFTHSHLQRGLKCGFRTWSNQGMSFEIYAFLLVDSDSYWNSPRSPSQGPGTRHGLHSGDTETGLTPKSKHAWWPHCPQRVNAVDLCAPNGEGEPPAFCYKGQLLLVLHQLLCCTQKQPASISLRNRASPAIDAGAVWSSPSPMLIKDDNSFPGHNGAFT